MKSIYSPQYREGSYIPVVHTYYDRADMLSTTVPEINHAHTLCEIMYVNEGAIMVAVRGETVTVGRRQFIWLDASVKHRLSLDDANPCSVMNIEFQMEELPPRGPSFGGLCQVDPALRALTAEAPPFMVLTDTDGTIYNLIKQIILLVDSMHPEAESLCSWLTSQILVQIARYREHSGHFSGIPIRNNYVAAALAFIDAHYLDSITAREIAQSLHVQATYLHKLFKENMQMTIGEYLNGLRLRHARALLKETDQTLLEISMACGFSSQQRLTELFRQNMGMTPGEFRAQNPQL